MIPTKQIENYVDSIDALLGVQIPEEYRPGVTSNLERLLIMAQLFMDTPAADEILVGPAFQP